MCVLRFVFVVLAADVRSEKVLPMTEIFFFIIIIVIKCSFLQNVLVPLVVVW